MDKNEDEENCNYTFIYSPRTNYDEKLKIEHEYYNDLKSKGFDPYTIRILKKHLKEELGKLSKEKFICILKRHLLSWQPNLECREKILIKLLSKFFDEIDTNNNGFLEWNEFIAFLINNPNTESNDSSLYSLQFYAPSKYKIDHKDQDNSKFSFMTSNNDPISYCFYIEKYKLLGIVHDGKSKIIFNNMKTQKRETFIIDLSQTQKEIDDYVKNEFKHKSDARLKKEELDNIKAKNKIHDKLKVLSKEKEYRSPTPENVKREIAKINGDNENNNQNFDNEKKNIKLKDRQFFAIATFFVDEYDLLFVSSSNCKITAWKFEYKKNDFINVNCSLNEAAKFIFEEDIIQIPLFSSELAQYTLCFDNATKSLYSGQEDGKIFKWEMFSAKPVYILDINKVKINHVTNTIVMETDRGENVRKFNFEHLYKLKKDLSAKNNSQDKNSNKKEDSKQKNKPKHVNYLKKHEEEKRKTVSCLLLLNNLRLLCSAYYTGQIILWDTMDKKPKKMYNDQHTIIYQLIYNPTKNIIYSCGFEHDIFVYDPYSEDNAIRKLKGHFGSISSIAFNQDNNELISVDIQGNIKIWDTNNYFNFHSLNINEEENLEENNNKNTKKKKESNLKPNSNYNVLSLTNLKQFLIYNENKILLYEKGKANNPTLCDDNQIIGCVFNSLSYELITFSTQRIKFWNLLTGKVKKMYEDFLNGAELFIYELDKRGKKCYIGENTGKVKCINLLNGKITKEFKQHNSSIVNIFHSLKLNILITGSTDMCVRFHTGIDDEEDIIREIFALPIDNIEKNSLKSLILDENEKMLIMALTTGWISYFDLSRYKFSNDFSGVENRTKRISPLSNICDLNDVKCVFISHVNGEKYINVQISNKYYKILKNEKFGKFCEQEEEKKIDNNSFNDNFNTPKKNIIFVSSYDSNSNKLFIGDHVGFITCYDLTSLHDIMNSENDENDILNIIKNNCIFPILLKFQPSKSAITFLDIPEKLSPKVILIGSDRTLKLYDFNNFNLIDSLKQISIKYNSVPIAIAFIENNPFSKSNIKEEEDSSYLVGEKLKAKLDKEKKENKIFEEIINNMRLMEKDQCKFLKQADIFNSIKKKENNFRIIYRDTIEKYLKIDPLDFKKATRSQIAEYSTKVLEYSAKKKLQDQLLGRKLPLGKSTTWNLEIDINELMNKENYELNKLISKVNALEEDINTTENIYQNTSIFNSSYKPLYLNNVNDKEKDELTKVINNKIVNTNLSMVKKYMKIKDERDIRKYENKKYHKKKNLSPIKQSVSTNAMKIKIHEEGKGRMNTLDCEKRQKRFKIPCNKSVNVYRKLGTEFHDQRFQVCKNQFDERINELSEPIKNLFLSIPKRGKLLPKLNINFITTDDKNKDKKKL